MLKIRSNISWPSCWARVSHQCRPCSAIHLRCMLKTPFTTLSTVSFLFKLCQCSARCERTGTTYQTSLVPSGFTLEYVRKYTNSPRPSKPKGAGRPS